MQNKWGEKPYFSLDYYLKEKYGHKIYKIALDGGMTCPNRDGVIDTRGCIFCSQGGSGEFAAPFDKEHPSVLSQLEAGKKLLENKTDENTEFIAYFQPYTNTYGTVEYLEKLYREALECEGCVGLSIATRPDCLSTPVLILLDNLKDEYPDKFIWIELGLQTIHRNSAVYIRRGYDLPVFEEAVRKLNDISIPVIVHIILGLPGETKSQMIQTIEYLNTFNIFGIKLQLLHVISGTDLELDYNERKFDVLSQDEYTEILIDCIEKLSPEIVIHRVTGDGKASMLVAPEWSKNKKNVLNTLIHTMKERDSFQGKTYETTGFINVI